MPRRYRTKCWPIWCSWLLGAVTGILLSPLATDAQTRPTGPLAMGARQTAFSGAPTWKRESIFTGEIVSAALVAQQDGSQGPPSALEFQADVRVLRPLHGDATQPGRMMKLRWPYPSQPGSSPPNAHAATPSPTSIHGIFFLDEKGSPLPVRLAGAPSYLGGYFLPLPESTANSPKDALGGRTPVEGLLAAEVVAAMEFWASAHGQQLDEAAARTPPGGWYPSLEAGHFQQAITLLGELDPEPLREAFTGLLRSPSAHVRLAGIHGLLRLGSLDALALLEQDYAVYHRAMRTVKWNQTLQHWDVAANPRSVDVAGRLALREEVEPFLESAFAAGLAASRIPEALPYLVVLLGSPHRSTRVAALRGVCAQTHGQGVHGSGAFHEAGRPALLARHVPGDIDAHCPQTIPIPDPRAESEAARFWQNWWPTASASIASDFRRNEHGAILPFPETSPPSRWLDQTKPSVELMPGGPRVALRQLLYPFRPNSLRGSAEDTLRAMMGQGSVATDEDWAAAAAVLKEHAVALQRIDETYMSFVRHPGANPPQPSVTGPSVAEASARRAAAHEQLLDQCLHRMQKALSARGWQDFNVMLQQRADRQQQYRLAAPRPPR